jgi:hypothetical protein
VRRCSLVRNSLTGFRGGTTPSASKGDVLLLLTPVSKYVTQ